MEQIIIKYRIVAAIITVIVALSLMFIRCKFEPDMVFVRGGTFRMGINDRYDNQKPVHSVTVRDFYIGKYEVTNAEYCRFLNERGNKIEEGAIWLDIDHSDCLIEKRGSSFYPKPGKENHPVIEVSWYGAKAYCEWAGGHLPTEAEWEYAARGGVKSRGYKYAGSNNIIEVAWNECYSGGDTHQVGTKKANELGIYDLSGNVDEWCQDIYHGNYTNAPTDGNAWESGNGALRVVRGGSWAYFFEDYSSVFFRYRFYQFLTKYNIGFRLARY